MIGGSINAGGASRNAEWTNAVGALIGNELVNIVIEQNLEIAGGLIANAEIDERGRLTDKGKLCLKAGNIIARKLHDYDNGVSYGLGLSLASKFNPLDGSSKESMNMPIKYGFDDKSRDLLPTIGKGVIDITNEIIGEINRSVSDHISGFKSSKAMLDSNIPVSDILEYLSPKPADDGKAKDKTGKDSEKNKQLGVRKSLLPQKSKKQINKLCSRS